MAAIVVRSLSVMSDRFWSSVLKALPPSFPALILALFSGLTFLKTNSGIFLSFCLGDIALTIDELPSTEGFLSDDESIKSLIEVSVSSLLIPLVSIGDWMIDISLLTLYCLVGNFTR